MKNIPIIGKILVILAAFGVFAIGAAIYSGEKMKTIDTEYSNLLLGEQRAAQYLAKSNRSFQNARAALADIIMLGSQGYRGRKSRVRCVSREFYQIHGRGRRIRVGQ